MSVTVAVGGTAILEATFYDEPGGSAVDPTTVSLSVLDVDGATAFGPYTYAGATVERAAIGFYRKQLAIPTNTAVGSYTAQWTVDIAGDINVGYETLLITAASPSPSSPVRRPWYCTREEVKGALESRETARDNAQVDRLIETASRMIDKGLKRSFYPLYATRTFDWPNSQRAKPWRLWLDDKELISAEIVVSGGTTIASTDYFLRPDVGPPFNRLEIDLDSSAAFVSGDTHQRSISITGLFGYSNDETIAGDLSAVVNSTTATTITVTDSASVGVGSIIRVDSERMLVASKRLLDTTQNLQTPLTAQANNTTVAVSDGTAFTVGEIITLDAERMVIVDIAANNLLVIRSYDGSTLAVHTASDIYAPRSLTVVRGALGTTAATHASGADIYTWLVPGPVKAVAIAQTMQLVRQERIGYAGTVGGTLGSSQRELGSEGLMNLWEQAREVVGRKGRFRTV